MSNTWDEYDNTEEWNASWEETAWTGQDEEDVFSYLCYRRGSRHDQQPGNSAQFSQDFELQPRRSWSNVVDDQHFSAEDYQNFEDETYDNQMQESGGDIGGYEETPSSFQTNRFHPYRGNGNGYSRANINNRGRKMQGPWARARPSPVKHQPISAGYSRGIPGKVLVPSTTTSFGYQRGTNSTRRRPSNWKGPSRGMHSHSDTATPHSSGGGQEAAKGLKARALLQTLRQLPPKPEPEKDRPATFPALMRAKASLLRGALWQRDAKSQTTPQTLNDSGTNTDVMTITLADDTKPQPPMQLNEIIDACNKAREDLVTLATVATESEKQEVVKGFIVLQNSFLEWLKTH